MVTADEIKNIILLLQREQVAKIAANMDNNGTLQSDKFNMYSKGKLKLVYIDFPDTDNLLPFILERGIASALKSRVEMFRSNDKSRVRLSFFIHANAPKSIYDTIARHIKKENGKESLIFVKYPNGKVRKA